MGYYGKKHIELRITDSFHTHGMWVLVKVDTVFGIKHEWVSINLALEDRCRNGWSGSFDPKVWVLDKVGTCMEFPNVCKLRLWDILRAFSLAPWSSLAGHFASRWYSLCLWFCWCGSFHPWDHCTSSSCPTMWTLQVGANPPGHQGK